MKNIIRMIICLSTIAIWNSAQSSAEDTIGWKQLIKDSVASNPGNEMIFPLINSIDANSDSVPNKVALAFNVWSADTDTKSFQTAKKFVELPIPCANPNPDSTYYNFEFELISETSDHNTMVVNYDVSCEDLDTFEWAFVTKSILYSADVTKSPAAGGVSWVKSWSLEFLSYHLFDWDNDSQKEIILTFPAVEDTSEDVRVRIFNQSDGTKEADIKRRVHNKY